MTKHCKKCFCK